MLESLRPAGTADDSLGVSFPVLRPYADSQESGNAKAGSLGSSPLFEDELTLSEEVLQRFEETEDSEDPTAPEGFEKTGQEEEDEGSQRENPQELSDEEEEQVRELQARDREVRAHEQAHKAAAGSLAAGGPVYEYETGPDGRRYAVGGHVNVRLETGNTPEETLQNAARIRRAALAPAEPSPQDRAVAAEAAQMAAEARAEIAAERQKEAQGEDEDAGGTSPASSATQVSSSESLSASEVPAGEESPLGEEPGLAPESSLLTQAIAAYSI